MKRAILTALLTPIGIMLIPLLLISFPFLLMGSVVWDLIKQGGEDGF